MLDAIQKRSLSHIWQEVIQATAVSPSTAVFIVIWLLLMISLPILNWTMGETVLRQGVSVAVVVQTIAVVSILKSTWKWQRIGTAFLIIAVLSFGVEQLGSRTGFPFGDYHYTANLQPQLGDVPLLIPLAWFMMLPPSWAVASRFSKQPLTFALISAGAMTAWDLFLDPQMVQWHLWVWDQPGAYFDIPLLNYFGWFITAFLLTLIIQPSNLHKRPLILIYAITWFLETFGLLFFWGLVGPAIIGGFMMGWFLWLGIRGIGIGD
ncbi:MAG: carotenoid biosynthesis protein [Chloroflexota bacterium]